jgi:hypothetical protein
LSSDPSLSANVNRYHLLDDEGAAPALLSGPRSVPLPEVHLGADGEAPFPRVDRICEDTEMSCGTYMKYRRELEKAGYLQTTQRPRRGDFTSNAYNLSEAPFMNFSPSVNFWSTQNGSTKITSLVGLG